ncbi:MAG: cobalamin-dependent protein, partial [Anaerolineae bacterium]|nr:cobalamin-dependent protein [Anaerolineae bacterium]
MTEQLITAIADMEEEQALALARQLLANGTPPAAVLDACRTAMEIVGRRFEQGEYFIPELILAGEMLKAISAEVKPLLAAGAQTAHKLGKVVIGTVKGDIHDIGKDIVVFMLDVNGFEVYDLGIDVPPQAFVDKIQETGAPIVALSGFLTLSYEAMKETVAAITAAGLRERVKIMVGGGTVDEQVCKYAGADAFGPDAMAAVALAK